MQQLERLNSSIDIIPLQQEHQQAVMDGRRPGTSGVLATGMINKPMERSRVDSIYRDPMIIQRVKSYLYENEDKVYIDVIEMADHLQKKFRDYRSKKRGPFRAMVRRAYDEITENLTKQADTHWHEDDDEIEVEADNLIPEYGNIYKSQMGNKQNGNSSDKELIDISSDDDNQATSNAVPSFRANEKESMEYETAQPSKRPHLSPSIEQARPTHSQYQEVASSTLKNRTEKSRKRPREKENASPIEPMLKKKAKDITVTNSTVKFADVGGNTKVLKTIVNLLLHLKHPEVYTNLGVSPPRGFLLHGPPGCGKTLLAHAIAGELQIPLLKVAAPELVAGVSGESEQRIRDLFEQAIAITPCIIFLDEIDAVISDRATAQRGMEKRIVSQLLSCLDELNLKDNGNKVLVIGATNRPESLDPALRRAGRFDREVSLGIPDKDARAAILEVHTSKVRLSPQINLQKIAALTPGFVGADLVALIREAAMEAVNRTLSTLKQNATVGVNKNEPEPNEVIIEEEPKKEFAPAEQDISDVIIEDDEPPAKSNICEVADTNETTKIAEPSDKTTEAESASSTTEEPKKPNETSEVQSSESVPSELLPDATSTPSDETKMTEETTTVQTSTDVSTATPETTETAKVPEDVPIASPDDATAVADPTIAPEPAEVYEELIELQVQAQNPARQQVEVGDLLGWLRDTPPLTAEQLALICVEEHDFESALKNVQPSAKREGFATVPDVTWDDVGSLQDIRQELQMTILAPIRYSERFDRLGLTTPSGVLLCGPPGCGKTLLAKAIANEAGINFISVKGPELLNMYVGESEKAVRQCFMRARNSAPCVIFFDELDALCPKRSDGDTNSTARVVNQMLTEMDGVEGRKGVFLMAASNRPDIIDPAVLRPGRLDKILYVGLPNPADRLDILRALTKNGTKPKLSAEVDLQEVAEDDRCNGLTGADLASLVREAGNEVLREIIVGLTTTEEICPRHIYAAFEKIRPSVKEKDLRHYEVLEKLYSVKKSQNTDVLMALAPPIDTTIEAMET